MFSLATRSMGFLAFVLHLVFSIDCASTSCIGDGDACIDDAPDKEIAFIQRQASRKKIDRAVEPVNDCWARESTTMAHLDFKNSIIGRQDLGHPDGFLQYTKITTDPNTNLFVDLIVTEVGGNYKAPDHNTTNGKGQYPSEFGQIGVHPGKGGVFDFQFVDTLDNEKSVTLEKVLFTFMDMDVGTNANRPTETLTANKFAQYWTWANTDILIGEETEGGTTFTASVIGNTPDNPTNPWQLTDVQKKRTVMFLYKNVSEIRFTYEVVNTGDGVDYTRMFFFDGETELICTELANCSSMDCTSGQRLKTAALGEFCVGNPCDISDTDLCCEDDLVTDCRAQDAYAMATLDFARLDFANSIVGTNTLGQPDGSLQYKKITQDPITHSDVDLIITEIGGNYIAPDDPTENGKNQYESFGQISIIQGNSGEFKFDFVDNLDNNRPVTLEKVFFTIMDLDVGLRHNAPTEVLTSTNLMGSADTMFTQYWTVANTEITMNKNNRGDSTFMAKRFPFGNNNDNPDNPMNLTPQQAARTVMFLFKNVNQFRFTYEVNTTELNLQGSRKFLFDGETELVCTELANCSSMTCKNGKLKQSALNEFCVGNPCDSSDTDLCCEEDECIGASCIIWGDPHVISFDLQQHIYKQHPVRESFFRTHEWKTNQQQIYERGTFWLVRSKFVHIQGEYKASNLNSSWTNLYTLAMSGPFLNNNTLIIRPKESAVTWNGHEILETIGTSFADESGIVSAKYHKGSRTVQDGSWAPGVDINLPMGVKLTVNRWKDNLNAEITMCKQEGGQDGQCGNFNGDHMDDVIDGNSVR